MSNEPCPICPEMLRKLADWIENGGQVGQAVKISVPDKKESNYGRRWMEEMAERVVQKVMF